MYGNRLLAALKLVRADQYESRFFVIMTSSSVLQTESTRLLNFIFASESNNVFIESNLLFWLTRIKTDIT